MNITKYLQKIVAKLVYPVTRKDWYESKGYASFEDFVKKQDGTEKKFDMRGLQAERISINAKLTNGRDASLDTVTITPGIEGNAKKVGAGKHIIYFFGRNEPYEVKWRELITDAREIGVTVHAFNLPGMRSSTGSMESFNDAVNSGIAQVNALIQQGIHPDDIILKGNCFGASVASEVQHKCAIQEVQIRTINSNSYRSLRDVILEAIPPLKLLPSFMSLLNFTGWNPNIEQKHLTNGPYTCIIHRAGDKTIAENAKLQTAIVQNKEELIVDGVPADELKVPGYEKDQAYFEQYNVLQLAKGAKVKDPHVAQLADMKWIDDKGIEQESWKLTEEYIKRSNAYIENHRQPKPKLPIMGYGEYEFPPKSQADLGKLAKTARKAEIITAAAERAR